MGSASRFTRPLICALCLPGFREKRACMLCCRAVLGGLRWREGEVERGRGGERERGEVERGWEGVWGGGERVSLLEGNLTTAGDPIPRPHQRYQGTAKESEDAFHSDEKGTEEGRSVSFPPTPTTPPLAPTLCTCVYRNASMLRNSVRLMRPCAGTPICRASTPIRSPQLYSANVCMCRCVCDRGVCVCARARARACVCKAHACTCGHRRVRA